VNSRLVLRSRNGNRRSRRGRYNRYALQGENRNKYTDPTGLELTLAVDKTTQQMTATLSLGRDTISYSIAVRTGVVPGNSVPNTNTTKLQPNGTNPTQFPNGTYKILGSSPNPTGNSKYGSTWLTTSATQVLSAVAGPQAGQQVVDKGYDIHFTTTTNTNGCIGISSDADMKLLVTLYKLNEQLDPGTSTVEVSGGQPATSNAATTATTSTAGTTGLAAGSDASVTSAPAATDSSNADQSTSQGKCND